MRIWIGPTLLLAALLAIACGGGTAVPTPNTELLESGPSWATQENLLGSGRARERIIDLKDGRRLEIESWHQRDGDNAVILHFKGRSSTDPILDHALV